MVSLVALKVKSNSFYSSCYLAWSIKLFNYPYNSNIWCSTISPHPDPSINIAELIFFIELIAVLQKLSDSAEKLSLTISFLQIYFIYFLK